jgi:hypothetical protein
LDKKSYSVITGDIIGSSALTPVQRRKLESFIKKAVSKTSAYFPEALPYETDVFRGDSFQFLIVRPVLSLRIALCFRLLLKSGLLFPVIDSRISIAAGSVEFINRKRISESNGEAFRLSGKALEDMDSDSCLTFSAPGLSGEDSLKIIISLLDELVSRCTAKQSLALFGALAGLQQADISKLPKPAITQQNVSKHLRSAGWKVINNSVVFYENNLK